MSESWGFFLSVSKYILKVLYHLVVETFNVILYRSLNVLPFVPMKCFMLFGLFVVNVLSYAFFLQRACFLILQVHASMNSHNGLLFLVMCVLCLEVIDLTLFMHIKQRARRYSPIRCMLVHVLL